MKTHRHFGTAAVEFALILPLLLLIVFGIIEFSLVLYDKALITNASREAARYGVMLTSPKRTTAQIKTVAQNYYCTQVVSFATTTCNTSDVTVLPAPDGTGVPTPHTSGEPLTVTISYTFTGLFVGTTLAAIGAPLKLSATTIMAYE